MANEPADLARPARVVGLYVAPKDSAPIEARELVELVAGLGVVGDRYSLHLGYWSDPRWPDQELTLVEGEVAFELGLNPGQLRRNIATRGIRLVELIDHQFQVGDAILYGVRPCDPCAHLDSLTRPGVAQALLCRGGLRARILQSGRIRLADPIEKLLTGG